MRSSLDRRHFLRLTAGMAGLSTATAFGLQMAAVGSAAGQAANDYKALVCIFLYGGNDSNNMVLATDADTWSRYWTARNQGSDPIALMPVGTPALAAGATSSVTGRVSALAKPENWGGVLPIVPRTAQAIPAGTNASSRTFALHPMMQPAKDLFDAGRLAVLANVGTLAQPVTKAQYNAKSVSLPSPLFSHNDQQSLWQAGAVEGAESGWGGRMGDLLASMNGQNTIFTAISTGGTGVFLSGSSIVQYPLSSGDVPAVKVNGAVAGSLFGSNAAPAAIRALMTDTSAVSDFSNDYATVTARSISAASVVNSAFAQPVVTGIPAVPTYTNPKGIVETNAIAVQLRTVARMVAAGPTFGLKRQVFLVNGGGWDSHDTQNADQSNNLAKLAQALSYFDGALSNIGGLDYRNCVTAFTASDFNRTINTNGDGTDHGWGGHHLVMGGAVKGGDIYGQFPTIGQDLAGFVNPDGIGAALIPTTSVDQYAATLGAWFGVSASDLATIFPNLGNFSRGNLGFV
jgi:uncharacterized protein (DUF1501 family)